ncbi:hypothetical protein ACEQ8H_007624 [Pleosporales sp. CAS-2024a]
MARLSGLPAEHHHEGPGDAPRRKRGRPTRSQTPSLSHEVASSSKRTASPVEQAHAKRTRRVQHDDEDQIADEMEQSFSRSQNGDTIHVESQAGQTTRRRHSEFPASAAVIDDDDDDDDSNNNNNSHAEDAAAPASAQAPSGLTPHLNRIGAPKRDFSSMRRVRRSLPTQLGVEPVDEQIDDNKYQFVPLAAVLDGRTRRRLRRSHLSQEVIDIEGHQKKDKKRLLELGKLLDAQKAKIEELEYQLEASRLGNIDIDTPELAQELEDAREELNALRASSLYNGSDREDSHDMSNLDGPADMSEDDDQPMLLVHPDELSLSRDIDVIATQDGAFSQRVKELSSQMTLESLQEVSQLLDDSLLEADDSVVADRIQDRAVERYEQQILRYERQLAASQGALRVITIELQNLHFLEPGASSNEILIEMRHGFATLRQELEKLFPNTTAGLTNQQLLHKIPELFGGIFFELKQKLSLLSSAQKSELLLRRQYEGVLDLLAESEDRVKELEQKEYSLDKSNEEKQRTIVDLEEHVATLTELTKSQEAELSNQTAQITGLNGDVDDKETTIARLREATETYRTNLESVTLTVTQLETEHEQTIARMEAEHADQVHGLEADLAVEQDARNVAETDAMQKGEYIEDLSRRIERTEAELDKLTIELDQLVKQLTEQTKARGEAEEQRDEQADIANEYANTIEGLNETIADLRAQINEFQDNLVAERTQRERTEANLDEANDKIEELNDCLHNSGIQANELRAKLFQLQQEKEQEIKDLEEDAQERENALNDQLHTEQDARLVAEKTVEKLNKQIEGVEATLATTEVDLVNMTEARQLLEEDREQQVTVLNQQLVDLRAKYMALETSSQSTIDALQANIIDLTNQVQEQQIEIKRLNQLIAEKDELYQQDTSLLKAEFAELKDELAAEQADNVKNQKEIASLSQRIESEANELLSMMNSHSSESTALRQTISTLEATISNHQANAATAASEHEATVLALETEITELQLVGTARVETITLLTSQIDDLKARFAKQEEDTRVTIDALNLGHRRLLEENEALAARLKERNQEALKAVLGMKAAHVVVKSNDIDLNKVQTGKVVKTTEKVKIGKKQKGGGAVGKRGVTRHWRESGFFEEPEQEEETMDGAQDDEEDFLAA